MKDINGNDIPGAVYHDIHGRKVDPKGGLLTVAQKVKDGIAHVGEGVKNALEAPLKHVFAGSKEPEPAAPEAPPKAADAPEVVLTPEPPAEPVAAEQPKAS